ncbi:MAG: class I SAM-dependent methyltransferase [Ruminococcaceae bacterium]|nr:class I SAM-dependent methyltransferase [Oscillospiraceae bacterium]
MTRAAQAAERLSAVIANRDVLEVACGTAEFSIAAAELAATVTCIDLDDSRLLSEVHKRENIIFRTMDAAAMRFGNNSFDTVVLYNAAFHVAEQLPAVLDECLRVLRPGGVLCVISSWKLDYAVITDTLLPLADTRGLRCHFTADTVYTCVILREPNR